MTGCTVQYGLRSASGIITPARDKAQAEAWAEYNHRSHLNAGEVLVHRLPGADWQTEEEAAIALADVGLVRAA